MRRTDRERDRAGTQMTTKAEILSRMVADSRGNTGDIDHFLKVYALASAIGSLEGLDPETQNTLELAAIVHDIACPLCREKYGNTSGAHQEAESEALLRAFFRPGELPAPTLERIIFLVTHHHTYTGVDGPDYQILLEADFLVNAGESEKWRARLPEIRKNMFRTAAGLALLDAMFPAGG